MAVVVRVRIGGRFRCCIATLEEMLADGTLKSEEGQTVTCRYCKKPLLIFRDDAWELNYDVILEKTYFHVEYDPKENSND